MSERNGYRPRRARLSDVTVQMMVTDPIGAVNATIFTSAKLVENASAALGAMPSLAKSAEQITPPGGVLLDEILRIKRTLDRLDRVGMFVAEELPETQKQLDALTYQLNESVNRIGELGRAVLTMTAVNTALNESIKLLSKGLGVAHGTAETLGRALNRSLGKEYEA